MTTKQQVIDAHRANPHWTGTQIATALGCHSAYVRATAHRNGLALPGAFGPRENPHSRARLIEAGRRLWAEPGTYETVGNREIAEAAGYTTGAIYCHFRGKEDLWRAAMGYEPPVDGPEVRALLQRMAQLVEAA